MSFYMIYAETMDDESTDYGFPPQFVAETDDREGAAKIMCEEVARDPALAVWATDDDNQRYYVDQGVLVAR